MPTICNGATVSSRNNHALSTATTGTASVSSDMTARSM
jgi:hypothetical protein